MHHNFLVQSAPHEQPIGNKDVSKELPSAEDKQMDGVSSNKKERENEIEDEAKGKLWLYLLPKCAQLDVLTCSCYLIDW